MHDEWLLLILYYLVCTPVGPILGIAAVFGCMCFVIKYFHNRAKIERLLERQIKLDDWVDGHPDTWDYEAVLREHDVDVGQESRDETGNDYYFGDYWFSWKHGTGTLRTTDRIIARKCAALYVSLWLLGVSASFANKLQQGYTLYLQMQKDARR